MKDQAWLMKQKKKKIITICIFEFWTGLRKTHYPELDGSKLSSAITEYCLLGFLLKSFFLSTSDSPFFGDFVRAYFANTFFPVFIRTV
jgi:hypothetical protein